MILFTLLLLVAVSAGFSSLARGYGRNSWLYAFIGIVVFVGSAFVFDLIILLIFHVKLGFITFASYPGLLGCWLLYSGLRRSWLKEKSASKTGALDDDLLKGDTRQ